MSREFAEHVGDMLSPLGPVTVRAMFGGFGIRLDGLMFALIARNTLFMKVDAANRPMFEEAGAEPFRPWEGKATALPYWEVPADLLEDGGGLCRWARAAFDAAVRTRRSGTKRTGKRRG